MSSTSSPLKYQNIDTGIAALEGFGTPGTLATVNNNPGNIIPGSFATQYGATSTNGGFAVFPTAAQGAAAEDALVGYYANQGDTIEQLVNAWVPPNAPGNTPAQTTAYANNLASYLGVSGSTPITEASQIGLNQTLNVPTTLQSPLGTGVTPVTGSLTNNPLGTAGSTSSSGLGNVLGAIGSGIGNAFGVSSGGGLGSLLIPGFTWGRVGAFLLGIIVVAGAIYLFKPAQNAINTAVKRGSETLAV